MKASGAHFRGGRFELFPLEKEPHVEVSYLSGKQEFDLWEQALERSLRLLHSTHTGIDLG
jgi:hypothetical protein